MAGLARGLPSQSAASQSSSDATSHSTTTPPPPTIATSPPNRTSIADDIADPPFGWARAYEEDCQPEGICALISRAYSPKCVEGEFSEVHMYGVLGSSLSSGAAQRGLRIRHETPVDGVA